MTPPAFFSAVLRAAALPMCCVVCGHGPAQETTAPAAAAAPGFVVERVTSLEISGEPVSAPKWSPDGRWIAYSLAKGNGIGIIRADGSLRQVLTREPGAGYRFAWAPDASGIAFRAAVKAGGPRQYVIRVVALENGEIESSSEAIADLQPPVWQQAADGMRWISHAPGPGAVAGPWRRPAGEAGLAANMADASPPLLVTHSRSIWLYAPEAAAPRRLSGEFGLNPVWNAQGTRLAFDALDVIAVTSPEAETGPQVLFPGQHPAWSPDGKWIAYQLTRDHSHAADDPRQHTADTLPHLHDDKTNHRIVDSEVWIGAADGSARVQLTHTPDLLEEDPDWSPDGTRIVCRLEDAGRLLILHLSPP